MSNEEKADSKVSDRLSKDLYKNHHHHVQILKVTITPQQEAVPGSLKGNLPGPLNIILIRAILTKMLTVVISGW